MFLFYLKYLADRVAMYKHAYTLYSAVRPFGCAVALGSYDEVDGPQLFMVDPSGVSFVSHTFLCCTILSLIFMYFIIRVTLAALWERPASLLKLKWRN